MRTLDIDVNATLDIDATIFDIDVNAAYKQFKRDLKERVPGKVLLSKVWGSYSHGTETPESDIDFTAVYQWNLTDTLSLFPPEETITHTGPDWQAHEIGKFCQLLLKGNPATIECLFTDRWCYVSPELSGLVGMRDQFVNTESLKQYLGYGRGQLQRLKAGTRIHAKGGEYNTKWAYHMIRVAMDAARIAHGLPPKVVKDGEELSLLMDIRAGKYTPEEISNMYENFESQIDALKPWDIPGEADKDLLNKWLVGLRCRTQDDW